ncbi:methyltransferase domain-containing protein [Streptomyces sp. NPDC005955]|uniref:class I SAM-dependent methyltransferase n=1 Tax=Streptomyces sp. NPDC005955 TaxID=3364738 RepID=UPI0036CA20E1
MPTLSSGDSRPAAREPHRARGPAESFGTDPARYDRTRPRYPDALVERVVAASPGPDVLDVGTGTGIAARQFRAAGCRVLGIDVDPRMAAFARRHGVETEVASFETWNRGERLFDAVVAGQTWHWVDPVVGTAGAARALRPGGRLAVFWNVQRPAPELAEAFADVRRRVLPDAPFPGDAGPGTTGYELLCDRADAALREQGSFGAPQRWQIDWERPYTRDAWLDQLPTFGGHAQLPPSARAELLAGTAAVIDALGGRFTMPYTTVVVTAARTGSD